MHEQAADGEAVQSIFDVCNAPLFLWLQPCFRICGTMQHCLSSDPENLIWLSCLEMLPHDVAFHHARNITSSDNPTRTSISPTWT